MKNNTTITAIRWTARVIGTLMVAFTLFIGIGEMLEGYNKHASDASNTFDTMMKITFSFWGLGLAGLILALWKEGLGGVVSLVSFIVFILFVAMNPKPDATFSFVLLVFLIPSVLYIWYWWLASKTPDKKSH